MAQVKLAELIGDLNRKEGSAREELIIQLLHRGRAGLKALAERIEDADGESVRAGVRSAAGRVVETVSSLPPNLRDSVPASRLLRTCGADALAAGASWHLETGGIDTARFLALEMLRWEGECASADGDAKTRARWVLAHAASREGERSEALDLARKAMRSTGPCRATAEDLALALSLEVEAGNGVGLREVTRAALERARQHAGEAGVMVSSIAGCLLDALDGGKWAHAGVITGEVAAAGLVWQLAIMVNTRDHARSRAKREIGALAEALFPYRALADDLAEASTLVVDELIPEETIARALVEPAQVGHRCLVLLGKVLASYSTPATAGRFQPCLALAEVLGKVRTRAAETWSWKEDMPDGAQGAPREPVHAFGDSDLAVLGLELLLRWGAGESPVPVRESRAIARAAMASAGRAYVEAEGLAVVVESDEGGFASASTPAGDLLWQAAIRALAAGGGEVTRESRRRVRVVFAREPDKGPSDPATMTRPPSPPATLTTDAGPDLSSWQGWLREVAAETRAARTDTTTDMVRILGYALHDLKNNLVFIRDWAAQFAVGATPRATVFRRLTTHIARVRRWTESTEAYLALRDPPSLAPIAPAVLAEEAARSIIPALAAHGVDLELCVTSGLPPILGDRDRILSALDNLLKNACDAAECGGRKVTLSVSRGRTEGEVIFCVIDTGPGTPPVGETQAAARDDEGMGLGLPAAHRVASQHGGRLEVGAAPHGGAVYSLAIPAHDPESGLRNAIRGYDLLPAPSRQAFRGADALLAGAAGGPDPVEPDPTAATTVFLYVKAVELALDGLLRPRIAPHQLQPLVLRLWDHGRGRLHAAGTQAVIATAAMLGVLPDAGFTRKVEGMLRHLAASNPARAMSDQLDWAIFLGLFARAYRAGGEEVSPALVLPPGTGVELLVVALAGLSRAAAGVTSPGGHVADIRRLAIECLGGLASLACPA